MRYELRGANYQINASLFLLVALAIPQAALSQGEGFGLTGVAQETAERYVGGEGLPVHPSTQPSALLAGEIPITADLIKSAITKAEPDRLNAIKSLENSIADDSRPNVIGGRAAIEDLQSQIRDLQHQKGKYLEGFPQNVGDVGIPGSRCILGIIQVVDGTNLLVGFSKNLYWLTGVDTLGLVHCHTMILG